MKMKAIAATVVVLFAGTLAAQAPQEAKPVPKDSVRVSFSGCTKGYVFTVGPRMPDIVGGVNVAPGTHLRMNGPKKLMTEISAYHGSMVAITGLMRKGQQGPDGVALGNGVRITPASPPTGGGVGASSVPSQIQIDVEGWSPATGSCPSS